MKRGIPPALHLARPRRGSLRPDVNVNERRNDVVARQTWPYGTRKPCLVQNVITNGTAGAIVCTVPDEPGAAYVLVGNATPLISEGDTGEIVFREGGATGGYWHYEATKQGS
jgi:hypothetical protein